jgi:hypothetical protein
VQLTESGEAPFGVVTHPTGVVHRGFFAESLGLRLYAALYLPKAPPVMGVVICPSWGLEANHEVQWSHRLAHQLAERGLAATIVQWPGTEDSEGDADDATTDSLVQAGLDVRLAVQDHCQPSDWAVVGVRVGAAPAALLAGALDAHRLLLVQPVTDLRRHFDDMERSARRAQLGAAISPGWAHGHPLPAGLRDPDDAARVQAAITARRDRTAVVQYRGSAREPLTEGVRVIRVRGTWSHARYVDHWRLRDAGVRWLLRSIRRSPR